MPRRALAAGLALCLAVLPPAQAWAQVRRAPAAPVKPIPGLGAMTGLGTPGASGISLTNPSALPRQSASAAPIPSALTPAAAAPEAPAGGKLAADAAQPTAAQAESPLSSLEAAVEQSADFAEESAGASPEDIKENPVFDGSGEKKHLVFDFHQPDFRAGYAAATAWTTGDAIVSGKRARFLEGMAYRIAELRKDEAAGREFISRAAGLDDAAVSRLADAYLAGPARAPALRENLADADYSQVYMTGAGWRPEKQLWLPTPSLLQRFNPRLRGQMRRRDERFMA
ncbi:MAG: hypothetical protein PHF00_03420, partial [Elusimicrobia bacterium]|nr:hypothetical protein [Elusimicrobiota bacterium]